MSVSPDRTATRKKIRTIMASKDLAASDLAKLTGYNHAYVRAIISGYTISPKARIKIELALGTPFWSTPEEFDAAWAKQKEGNREA